MGKAAFIGVILCSLLLSSGIALAGNGSWYDTPTHYTRTIVVDAASNNGFTSISEAYNSITSATVDKPILLKIKPGTYDIGALVFDKDYIDIQGSGVGVTVLNAKVPDYGEFRAIYLTGLSRLSDFSVELNVGPGRADSGTLTGIWSLATNYIPAQLKNLSISSHFQDNIALPPTRIYGIVAAAANANHHSLDAENITINFNLPDGIDGTGIQSSTYTRIADSAIVVTGNARTYGVMLLDSIYFGRTISNTNIYASSPAESVALMVNGSSNFSATNSSFTSPGTALLYGLASGEIVDSVIDGRIVHSPVVNIVFTNCVDGNGNPIVSP